MNFLNKVICGEASSICKQIPENTIDLILCSPPYDNLRTYKGFTFNFEEIAKELYRVTKDGGIVIWIVGDGTEDGSETLTSFRQAIFFKDICGFKMHDTMIYQKSGFNFPANNRYHQCFEYIFVLSKGKPKTFNPIIDRPNKYVGQKAHGRHRGKDENDYKDMSKIVKAKPVQEFGKRYNVWYVKVGGGHVTPDKIAHKHPAIFPDKLAADLIISYSNQGDLVLDPLCGSGTALKMAKKLHRNFIGIDISQDYCNLSEERLKL